MTRKLKKIARSRFDDVQIVFALWQKDELKVGVGVHVLTFDKSEGERIWGMLGGDDDPDWDAPKGKTGRWKQ